MIMQSFFVFSSFLDNYEKLAREVFPDVGNLLKSLSAPLALRSLTVNQNMGGGPDILDRCGFISDIGSSLESFTYSTGRYHFDDNLDNANPQY